MLLLTKDESNLTVHCLKLHKWLPYHYFNPPKLVWNLFKDNKNVVPVSNFEQTSYVVNASISYFVHYLLD